MLRVPWTTSRGSASSDLFSSFPFLSLPFPAVLPCFKVPSRSFAAPHPQVMKLEHIPGLGYPTGQDNGMRSLLSRFSRSIVVSPPQVMELEHIPGLGYPSGQDNAIQWSSDEDDGPALHDSCQDHHPGCVNWAKWVRPISRQASISRTCLAEIAGVGAPPVWCERTGSLLLKPQSMQ